MAIEIGAKNLYKAYGIPALDITFANKKSLVDRISGNNLITFTRASTATYVGADGLIKSAAVNEPRFDHNPTTGESLGLLVEEARTNQITYSNAQANSSGWFFDGNKGGLNGAGGKNYFVVTSNTTETLAPDGTFTATKLTAPATILNSTATPGITEFSYPLHLVSQISTTGNPLTCSFYVKDPSNFANGLNKIGIMSGGFFNPAKQYGTFDLVNKQTSSANATITAFPNGWYRLTFTVTEGGVFGFNAWNGLTSPLYIWGAQCEAGSFPTSYIPTTTATVTRAADVASMTGTNFSSWYNQSQGTFSANLLPIEPANDGVATGGAVFLDLQGDGFILQSRVGSSYAIRTNDPSGFNFEAISTVNGKINFSIGLSSDGSTSISRGSSPAVVNMSIGTLPKTGLLIGSGNRGGTWGASRTGSCVFSRLTYYPVRLPDAQLQTLTAT